MIRLGDFGQTTTLDVTSEPANYQGERPWQHYVVLSDRNIHLRRVSDASVDASADDFLLLEGRYAEVTIPEEGYLSFVLANGEPDGLIRITPACG